MKQLVQRNAVLAVLLTFCILDPQAFAETTLIKFGKDAQWRYQDDGKAQSAEWYEPSFDDSKWKLGPAPLGYGDGGLNTTVSFGDNPKNKHITVYFRHHFDVPDADVFGKLVLLIRSDDGIIVYLNGDEVIRNNLPKGNIQFASRATRLKDLLDERLYRRFVVPAATLVSGANVIAVEVHQVNPWSSDLFLDLVLRASGVDEKLRPTLVPDALGATLQYRTKHYIGAETTIPDGYVDGGRGMGIGIDGSFDSGRELIVVDRSRDTFLREHLAFARSEEVKALEPLKRSERLATYVLQNMALGKNDGFSMGAVALMVEEYKNQGTLLGEVQRICGAGVCRHRSLLFKMLADEAGLDVALVRGNYKDGRTFGGHAWNELHLEDGRRVLFDVMNGRAEPIDSQGSTVSRRYLTIRNQPWYTKTDESGP